MTAAVTVADGHIYLTAPYSAADVERCRSVPGGRWEPGRRRWAYAASRTTAEALVAAFGVLHTDGGFDALLAATAQSRGGAGPIPLLRTAAWRHQREAYAWASGRDAALLQVVMGGGKSLITVGLVANSASDLPSLVLCPVSVMPVWVEQFGRHAAPEANVVVRLATSHPKMRVADKARIAQEHLTEARRDGKRLVLVLNYESARMDPFASWALRQQWDYVVLDESQRAKAPTGVTSRFVAKLARQAQHRLALTGTPLPHGPLDAFGQFRFLDPGVFGTSFVRFRSRYALMGGFQQHQVVGYQRLDELARKMAPLTFQAGAEVLELPETMHLTRTAAMGAEGRRVYQEIKNELVSEVLAGTVTAANGAVKLLRLQQVTSGFVRTEDGVDVAVDDAKARLLAELLEDLPPNEPVVVFCRFTHDLATVGRVARANGRAVMELSGRVDELAAWQDASGGEVLAVQIQSGGVGISLVRARYCVYFSLGWSLGDYEQSVARTHRPGQERSTVFYHLLVEDSVDSTLYDALDKRRDLVSSVLAELAGRA